MKPKQQRLILGIFAVLAVSGAGFLALSALESKAAYFYSPSDLATSDVEPGKAFRLGGMVADKSITREPDGVTMRFVVQDESNRQSVVFKGIAPDLFKENSGVIAEGSLDASGQFIATNLLAKHDEKYMPPKLDGKMHKTGEVSQ
ncbi:MAG: cytochrome c maturation protein CcmE [Sphingorhabdus sp.]|uniref:cytochrome c maturation protein CcmE n=1 Tax=Sphingorhabdus sp. TaxID=1902408 RepID=UPI003C9A510B